MNHILLDVYSKLSDIQHTELRLKYKDSAMGLKMLDFLSGISGADFKTADAVGHVYAKAKSEEYSVLENRYFKLRKKILDDIHGLSGEKSSQLLAEEEEALNQCKYLISTGGKKEAYKKLMELEKLCWERNIFELLPAILDSLIFCNQSFNELDKNKELYRRMEEANRLQYDVNRVNILSRQVYDVFFTQGLSHAKSQFSALKELAEKNKQYPRFLMCYHYMSLYYKAGAPEYFENMHVVSRHLTEFKKLYEGHSHLPMMNYRANYAKHFHFHFNHVTAMFHNNRCEFEEAYECVKKTWDLAQSTDSVYKQYKTEALYSNLFNVQTITGRYKEAMETANSYISYLKANSHFDRLPYANMLKAILYISAWPQTFKMDIGYLHEQADEYIKQVKKQESLELTYGQSMLLKAQLYLTQGQYAKAEALIQKKEVTLWLDELKAKDLIEDMMHILCKDKDEQKLNELLKKIQQRKLKASNSDQFRLLYGLMGYINYCLKNKSA